MQLIWEVTEKLAYIGCSPYQRISQKVIDAYPESSKADFFAQIIFYHSVIQNHCIAIHCGLQIAVEATFVWEAFYP